MDLFKQDRKVFCGTVRVGPDVADAENAKDHRWQQRDDANQHEQYALEPASLILEIREGGSRWYPAGWLGHRNLSLRNSGAQAKDVAGDEPCRSTNKSHAIAREGALSEEESAPRRLKPFSRLRN
jgi:hypothetical protein